MPLLGGYLQLPAPESIPIGELLRELLRHVENAQPFSLRALDTYTVMRLRGGCATRRLGDAGAGLIYSRTSAGILVSTLKRTSA